MYQLLVPVDRNEGRAEAQVEALVGAPYEVDEIVARILHVVEDVETPFGGGGPDYADAMEEEVALERVPNPVETRGVPTDAILDIVEARDVDAVAIGCRRRTPVGKVVFGSVAQEVIRRSECPILVAPR